MAVGVTATGRPPEHLCVVAPLFVSPTERNAGIGSSLLAVAVGLTRFAGQGWCVDYAARAAVSWWMVASYSAGLRYPRLLWIRRVLYQPSMYSNTAGRSPARVGHGRV